MEAKKEKTMNSDSKSFYGRRIVRIQNENGDQKLVWSGQWVGHSRYGGNPDGTSRQRSRLLNRWPGYRIVAISRKIYWGTDKKLFAHREVLRKAGDCFHVQIVSGDEVLSN